MATETVNLNEVKPVFDEARFRKWYAERASRLGLSLNPDDPQHFYDYRAAFSAGADPDKSGHWPSEFKRLGHPNLLVGGVDTRTGISTETVALDEVRPLAKVALPAAKPKAPFISGESRFSQFLDLLNTPQQLMFGALNQRPGESLVDAAERGAREDIRFGNVLEETDFLKSALVPDVGETGTLAEVQKAFKLQSLGDPGNPLRLLAELEAGKDASPRKVSLAATGLAGDVLLDPLMLVPFEKVASLGGRVVTRGTGVLRNALPPSAIERIRPLVQAFSKTALRTEQEKRVIEIADIVKGQLLRERTEILERAATRSAKINKIAKSSGLKREQVDQLITAVVEEKKAAQKGIPVGEDIVSEWQLPGSTEESLKRVSLAADAAETVPASTKAQIAESIRDVRSRTTRTLATAPEAVRTEGLGVKQAAESVLAAEMRAGLPIQELEDARLDYILHLLTPEARKAAMKMPEFVGAGFREFSPAHASQLTRRLRGLSINEINLLAADGKLPGFDGQVIKKFMVDDPATLLAVRELRGAKAIADLKVLRQSADELGKLRGQAPLHYAELGITKSADPRLKAIGEQFKDILFEPEVAQHLNKVIETTHLPDTLSRFVRAYDSIQNVWKTITLTLFPSYHTRNAVGNTWNNYLAGLVDPNWYLLSANVQRKSTESVKLGGRVYRREELTKLADDFGVTGRGFITGETPTGLRQLGGAIGPQDIPGVKQATRIGLRVGQAIEDNARIAHFMWRLDKGDTPLAASRSVKKYLFDYVTGLTDFEQKFMRRIMPFYSWTRFNLPLQVSGLVNNPRPFIRLAELERTARTDEPSGRLDRFNKELIPDYIKANVGIPLRTDREGNPEYFLLGGWLPAADLEILLTGNILDEAKSQLSPLIKQPIEQAANVDLWLDRKIEEFPGEKQKFLGMDVRRRLVHFARNIRLLSEIDRLMKVADKDLSDEESSKLGAVVRTLFGLKAHRVDVGKEVRRKRFEKQEIRRRQRSLARRGNEANVEVLQEILEEED
jgi:hypothetical protein